MSSALPIPVHLAASFDWETLLPVLFLVLYGLAQFLSARKKGAAAAEETEQAEVDAEERARQIREEIRRRIEERRRAAEGQAPQPAAPAPAYDPRLPESQQRRMPAAPAAPVFMPGAESDFEQRLREQRRKLEEARREREEAHARALEIERRAMEARPGRPIQRKRAAAGAPAGLQGPAQLRRQLVSNLQQPESVRLAVLLREVLGPPVALR